MTSRGFAFPATYNQAHFKKAGLETPKTWAELAKRGAVLKRQGHPVGIPISHCSDANTTYWSVAWSYGAKVLEADGKTPGINSDRTAQVIERYKELYRNAMEPEAKKMPIADDINHHTSPGGPAGTHSAPPNLGLGIWKFSKNVELAREFRPGTAEGRLRGPPAHGRRFPRARGGRTRPVRPPRTRARVVGAGARLRLQPDRARAPAHRVPGGLPVRPRWSRSTSCWSPR